MSIQFPHATRSLRDDRLVPAVVATAAVSLLLFAWGVWLVAARVPIVERCVVAGPAAGGGLDARCPPEVIARVPLGARAAVLPAGDGQASPAVVHLLPGRFERRLAPDTLRLVAPDGRDLGAPDGGEVQITVAEVSPLALIAGGGAPRRAP